MSAGETERKGKKREGETNLIRKIGAKGEGKAESRDEKGIKKREKVAIAETAQRRGRK